MKTPRLSFVLSLLSLAVIGVRGASGGALFHPYTTKPVLEGANSVAIGDVTGDGRKDLVAVQASYDSVYVFAQTPAGTLLPAVRYRAPIAGSVIGASVDIADLNDDGRNDVLVNLSGAVGVMLQTPSGLLSSAVAYPTQMNSFSNVYLTRSGDLNHDGRADAVSIDWGTQSELADVFLQTPSGVLGPSQTYVVDHGGYDDLEVGDVNGDGRDDIVVSSGQGLYIGILHQNASGGFDPAVYVTLPVPESANGVDIGDVNHDGRNDIVVSYGGNRPDSRVGVYLQDSNGNLAVPFVLPSYDIPEPIEVADVNADGLEDILVVHGGWLRLGVYLQGMSGLLPEELYPIPYASHYSPHGLAIGDLNGDSWADVAIADYTQNGGVTILYNTAPFTSIVASFTNGEAFPNRVELTWRLGGDATTATVERSEASSGTWSPLGTIAVDGDRQIRFSDHAVTPGGRYGYRLSIFEEGEVTQAGEVWMDVPEAEALPLHVAASNPGRNRLQASVTLPSAEEATLDLMDVTGRRLATVDVGSLGAGTHQVDLTPARRLAPGMYWLRLTQGKSFRTAKTVVF